MPNLALTDLRRDAIRVRGHTTIKKMPEASGQTFKEGDLLLVNDDSTIASAAAAGSQMEDGNELLYGIARAYASGTTNALIDVEVFEEDTEIRLPLFHTTAANANFDNTMIGDVHPLINETTGSWMCDVTDATNPILQISDRANDYDGVSMAVGDRYASVWCRVIRLQRAMGSEVAYPT